MCTSQYGTLPESVVHLHIKVQGAAQEMMGMHVRQAGTPATRTELCVCWPPSTPSSLVVGAGVVNGTPPRSSTPKVPGAERLREPVAPGRLAPLPAGQPHVSVWQITGAVAVNGTLPGLFTPMISGAEKLQKLEAPERCGKYLCR